MRAPAVQARPAKKARPRRRWWMRVLRLLALAVVAVYAVEFLAIAYLRFLPPLTTGVQMQRRGEALLSGRKYEKRYDWEPLGRISPHLRHAVVAAEDTRFFDHGGVDWKEVSKVAEESLESGEIERGASTISQQLVKNLFLTTHRSSVRKVLEFAMVWPAELVLPKERILELYLNVIEWGPGVYGAEAAARYHYGVSARDLSRDQAARLAAVIPAPSRRKPARMSNYAGRILTRMQQMGW